MVNKLYDEQICGNIEVTDGVTRICVLRRDAEHDRCSMYKIDLGGGTGGKFGITFYTPNMELRWHPNSDVQLPSSRWERSVLRLMIEEFLAQNTGFWVQGKGTVTMGDVK